MIDKLKLRGVNLGHVFIQPATLCHWFLIVTSSLLMSAPPPVNSQVLNKFINLQNWAMEEEVIYHAAKARISRVKRELNLLERFVKDYEESTVQHLGGLRNENLLKAMNESAPLRARLAASNPILIHRMSHRAASIVPKIMDLVLVQDESEEKLREVLGQFANPLEGDKMINVVGDAFGQYHEYLPKDVDRLDSLDSLAALYDSFDRFLSPFTFSAQLSSETAHPVLIDAKLASMISLKAVEHGMYANAIDWIAYAQARVDSTDGPIPLGDDSISKDLVQYLREFMVNTHNEEMSFAVDLFPSTSAYLNFFTEAVDDTILTEKEKFQKRRSSLQFEIETTGECPKCAEDEILTAAYYSLCHGLTLQPLAISSFLKCYLDSARHPFFTLAPLKVEQLSDFPRVFQFYDVLGDSEMEQALQHMEKLPVEPGWIQQFPDEFGTRVPPPTTAAFAPLSVDQRELKSIAKKMEMITGMRVFEEKKTVSLKKRGSSPPAKIGWTSRARSIPTPTDDANVDVFQGDKDSFLMTEFVAGRYDALHSDVRNSTKAAEREEHLDRFAGMTFYMNEVDQGGATPFITAGVFSPHQKGSAIYWENFTPEAESRYDVWYGGCPVLRGHKIIVTKHFHYSKQYARLQCDLDSQPQYPQTTENISF